MKIIKKLAYPLLVLFTLFGFIILSYPSVSNFLNELFNESNYSNYTKNTESSSKDELDKQLASAYKYNEALAVSYFDNSDNSDYINAYSRILDFGDGLIGYIEIPKINIKIPIYHESDDNDELLTKGAVQLKGTSLPVGGSSTHSAISAHSGYPAKKFFDDIDTLTAGDVIYIYVLNQTLTYEVKSSEVVNPDDTANLEIVENEDLLTLITCYPYGINTHRLLVHAERVNTDNDTSSNDEALKTESSVNYVPMIIVGAAFILLTVFLVIIKIFLKRGSKNEKIHKGKSRGNRSKTQKN